MRAHVFRDKTSVFFFLLQKQIQWILTTKIILIINIKKYTRWSVQTKKLNCFLHCSWSTLLSESVSGIKRVDSQLRAWREQKVRTNVHLSEGWRSPWLVCNDQVFVRGFLTVHGLSVSIKCLQPHPRLFTPALPKIRFEEIGVEIVIVPCGDSAFRNKCVRDKNNGMLIHQICDEPLSF